MTVIQIYVNPCPDDNSEDKCDWLYVKNKKTEKVYKMVAFAIPDEESALSFYKILNYLSSIFKDN